MELNKQIGEEEVSLEEDPLDQSHRVVKIPIFYEDSDDYAPFDDEIDSKET
ncbi:MAG: hypothetical protein M0R50_05940 [Candidatus Cloacimonetes bacterium]|nr:hypothetical protein [Candidatus Cloacimonadota bacterium]